MKNTMNALVILSVLLLLSLQAAGNEISTVSHTLSGKGWVYQRFAQLKESLHKRLLRDFRSETNPEQAEHYARMALLFAVENCSNGMDDDGDGLVDAADPDCGGNIMTTIPTGSYIINMGAQPQTEENALRPYGLVWYLLHYFEVPVMWSINPSKGKDGVDFTYYGVEYRGGPFIISAEYRTPSVDSLIAAWEVLGVEGVTTISDFQAPINRTLSYSMNWTLNQQNGGIAQEYLDRAGIPESAYNWVLPQNLDCCNDVFLMPHSEPVWATHHDLLSWNASEASGGCRGTIWAGCKSGSELENIVNPANATQRMNFLMLNPVAPATTPAVPSGNHDDGSIPPPYVHQYHGHPVMQFLGRMDGSTENGAEQVYLPKTGWRPSTFIGVYDDSHENVPSLSPGPAAKVAFGSAFGDPTRGYIMYQGGHRLDKDDGPGSIASQRAFFNFSFLAGGHKAIQASANIPEEMNATQAYNLSATATGGSGIYQFHWESSCGGTFSNPYSANTTYTAPDVLTSQNCYLKVMVTDDCGTRVGFENVYIRLLPRPMPPIGVNDFGTTQPGTPVIVNALANDSDPNMDPITLSGFIGSANTGKGVFVNNGDGTATYTPRYDFTGNDQINYQVCDNTPPSLNGPLCDTATIFITVNWSDVNGCYPNEYWTVVSSGNATAVTAQNSVGNPAEALGSPALVVNANNYYAKIDNDADYLVLDMGKTFVVGDTLWIYLGTDDGNAGQLYVQSTLTSTNYSTGTGFFNPRTYSSSKDLDNPVPQQDVVPYVVATGSIRYLRFNRVAGQGKPSINGISYSLRDCVSAMPVAQNDVATVCEDNTVDINVKANDSDPRALPLTVSLLTLPSNGTATLLPDEKVRYRPAADYSGSDNFTYQICNTNNLCATATVSITVTDDGCPAGQYKLNCAGSCILSPYNPPNAVDDYSTTFSGVPVTIKVQLNDVDPSGLGLTTSLFNGNPPEHGAVVLSGTDLIYTPPANFAGLDTFAYTVCNFYGCDNALVIVDVICADPGSGNAIHGTVFQDLNADGSWQQNEAGIQNVRVRLYSDIDKNGLVSASDIQLDSMLSDATGEYTFRVTPPVSSGSSGMTTVELLKQISASSDDAEEEGTNGANLGAGGMYLASTDLEIVNDYQNPSSGTQKVGLRFTGLNIPQGSTITGAYLYFKATGADAPNTNSGATTLNIKGQAADNATTFTSTLNNISSRSTTAAAVSWSPTNWSTGTVYGSPNLAAIVQEIVNRPGWISGSSMAFIISGSGSRSADSYDDAAADAPALYITYQGWASDPSQGAGVWSDSNTPEYSNWNGSTFGATTNAALAGDRWRTIAGAASPNRNEKIVVGIGTSGQVNGQLWNGTTWSALPINPLGTATETYWWGSTVAYEQLSGDAMLVWNAGSGGLKYSIWNGSSWTASANVSSYTGGEPQQMKLASKPGSDEMVLAVNDINADDYALIWNGNSWSNSSSLTLNPTQDTYLSISNTARNYGTCNDLLASAGSYNALMKFDLSSIPAGATIVSAKLKLKKNGGGTGGQTVRIHRATSDWVEGTKCSNNEKPNWIVRNATSSWTTPGGDFDPAVFASTTVTSNILYTWDILSLVQGWHSGTYSNQGLVIYNTTSTDHVSFRSSEDGTPPILEITYQFGAGSSTILLDNSGTAESDQTGLDVAYEYGTGKAMVVYNKASDAKAYYRFWDGNAWSAESNFSPPAGTTSTLSWANLASDPTSNRIVFGGLTTGGTAAHAWLNVWNGSSWGTSTLATNGATGSTHPNLSVAFERLSGKAMAVYGKNGLSNIYYRTWSAAGGWSAEQTGPGVSAVPNTMVIYPGANSNHIMAAVQNNSSQLRYALWNGSSWGSASLATSSTGETKNQPFLFLWNRIPVQPPSINTGYYVLKAVPATFPSNSSLTTDNLESAVLLSVGETDCFNNFGLLPHLPPIANPDTAYVDAGTTATIIAVANDNDPEGTPLTVTLLSNPTNGTAVNNQNGSVNFTPNNGWTGTNTFLYQVCDQGSPSLCDTSTITVIVNVLINDAPVAQDDYDTTYVNQEVETNVLLNDFDQEFGKLTVSLPGGILKPAYGTVLVLNNQDIVYTPNSGYTGNDAYEYRVCDDRTPSLCDIAKVFIHVKNNPPDARDDAAATNTNVPISIDVLNNDFEPDGHNIIILSGGSTQAATGSASKKGGTVTLNINGTPANYADDYFYYNPPAGFAGLDTFYYKVQDSGTPNYTDVAMVVVNVTARIDLELTKTVSPAVSSINQNVTFTLTLLNKGPAVANQIRVKDYLTGSYQYISDNGAGSFDPVSKIWYVPTLAANQTRTLTITAKILNATALKNVAEVIAANETDIDSRPDNDDGDQSEDDEDAATPGLQEICNNGLEDDGDGLVDCADPQCSNGLNVSLSSVPAAICTGGSATLTASGSGGNGALTYTWSNSLGTGTSKSVTPASSTTYRVTISDANGCTATAQSTVTVNADPAITAAPTGATICSGTTHTLNVTATGGTPALTYQWQSSPNNSAWSNIGGATASSYTTPALSATTYYRVVVSATGNGCGTVISGAATVTVNSLPVANAGADVSICSGASTTLTANSSGSSNNYTFSWSHGLGTGTSKTISPVTTTTYTVTVTSIATGCSATDQVIVTVKQAPVAFAGFDVTACKNVNTTLTASGTGGLQPYTYAWSNGLGNTASVVASPSSTSSYTVTVTSADGCSSTDQVTINIVNCPENCTNGVDDDGDGQVDCADSNCAPAPTAGNNVSICTGETVTLTASVPNGTGSYTYAWSNGLGSGATKSVSPSGTTAYTVTVTNFAGCTGTAQVIVTVAPCNEVCDNNLDDDGDGLTDCADPDCALTGMPQLANDNYELCPATPYSHNVRNNDANLKMPIFSIAALPSHGTVTLDTLGNFTYTPSGVFCGADQFTYQVCNGSVGGCCATATVTLDLEDKTPPLLLNVPPDITIQCDDVVPIPAMVYAFDSCPGIYVWLDETSNYTQGALCDQEQIIRTWEATDLCGNSSTGTQTITIADNVAPDVFTIYTLPNGKKLIAGVAEIVSQHWKQVTFPVAFSATPLVFSQVVSSADNSAVTVRMRDVSKTYFEMRLQEEENNDGVHQGEQVAWLAIEPGAFNSGATLEAFLKTNVTSSWNTVLLSQTYASQPHVLTSVQTYANADPVATRLNNHTNVSFQMRMQEETSIDPETAHPAESLAYLAVNANARLRDKDGLLFGETGFKSITTTWQTVNLSRRYINPVVIAGSPGFLDGEPVTVRVRNVTPTSFEVRLQEWDYQNGSHLTENISYLVVEGSITFPGDACTYVKGGVELPENIVSRDNCGGSVPAEYQGGFQVSGSNILVQHEWMVGDGCGNTLKLILPDTCPGVAVRLKALLFGALLNSNNSGLMRDDLRTKLLLPEEEPYSALSTFVHRGFGGEEKIKQGLFSVSGEKAVTDWIFVEIRHPMEPDSILATQSVLVQRNGKVVNANGDSVLVFFGLPSDLYHVAVRHRNHVGMMTANPVFLTADNPPLVDFADPLVPVFQDAWAGKFHAGKRAMWPGDLNGDGSVIYQGPQNDVFSLFWRVVSDNLNEDFLANYISKGYDRCDLNLDGNIIYQGPNNERAMVLYHATLAHPNNTGLLANFMVPALLP